MALTHPDDLRAERDRMQAQAKQLRETADDLDRRAVALNVVAERNARILERQISRG